MEKVKVSRQELLNVINKNRAEHEQLYNQAMEGYKHTMTKTLRALLADVKAGKTIPAYISSPAPVNNLREYDQALKMLEMSVDEVIELDNASFAKLVMDDWEWKQAAMLTNTMYAASAPRR